MFEPNFNLVIKNLSENSTLLDICVEIEDFLDNLDIAAYENWYDGVIVQGPIIERYWVNITLLYDYNKMPNPAAAAKLIKYGCLVNYRKSKIELVVEPNSRQDLDGKKMKKNFKPIWLVEIKMPKRFVSNFDKEQLSMEEINKKDLEKNALDNTTDESLDNTDDNLDNTDNTDNTEDPMTSEADKILSGE